MLRVTFNGVDLTKYLVVLKGFTAFDGADFKVSTLEYQTLNGEEFNYTRKGSKKIEMPFYVKYESAAEYDHLQTLLNVSEPKPLEFSHMPNRVFYAIPSGTLDFEEYKMNGKGTITWLIPDGLAHSKDIKAFQFNFNSAKGCYETTIVNNGSESVPINYRVKLKKESGYLGIVSQYGVIQYGNSKEQDFTEAKKSVKLLNNKGGDFADWTRGNYFCENPAKKDVADMGVWNSFGGWLGTLPSGYTDTSNSPSGGYFGAIQEFILPEQATDWYLWARAWFETGRMGQTGAWALTVIDQDNHLIAGMVLEKYDRVGNTALCSFLIGDNGGSLVKKTIQFTPHYWIDRNNSNPYGSESRDQNRNMFDLKKVGDKVTYYWYGSHFTFSDSRLTNKKATKLQFFVGQMAGRNTTNQLVTHHYLSDLSFTKLNVPYWVDVPNRFPSGADMFVDGEKGNLYVNNLISHDDEVIGTNYFYAPPGETTIQLYVSSFSEIESATAEIKEAYI